MGLSRNDANLLRDIWVKMRDRRIMRKKGSGKTNGAK
jgi:hypothetical protein